MKTIWLKNVEADQHEAVKNAFNSSADIRAKLKDICQDKIDSVMSTHKNQYNGASWAYEQADCIGYRRALEEIISLLEN